MNSILPRSVLIVYLLVPAAVTAEDAIVAVATNFIEVAQKLESAFEEAGEHELVFTSGSTGKLFAQVVQGAPFDILLAADAERPARLEELDFGIPGTRFTYATGRLVLWSPDSDRVRGDGRSALEAEQTSVLAIANPDLAPYGQAARQVLTNLELWAALQNRIVMGENVGQTFAYVATRNAEFGFVAFSQVISERNEQPGSHWDVPDELHEPIRQDAILLKHGADNTAAIDFLGFLRSESAQTLIRASGYHTD